MNQFVSFLQVLTANNNKEWFDANRGLYDSVKRDFEEIIGAILKDLALMDPSFDLLMPKECIFRINRDVRFAKDKSPYKTHFAAYLAKGGRKSRFAGVYIQLGVDKTLVGGGIWEPVAADLFKVRQEIEYHLDEFKNAASIWGDLSYLESSEVATVRNVPKGFDKDSPASKYLKMKSYLLTKEFKTQELDVSELRRSCKMLLPFTQFINRALD